MAYPRELENVEYMEYLQKWSTGEVEGPKLSKEEWRKKKKEEGDKVQSVLTE